MIQSQQPYVGKNIGEIHQIVNRYCYPYPNYNNSQNELFLLQNLNSQSRDKIQSQPNNIYKLQMKQDLDRLKLDFIVIGNQNTGKTSLIKRYVTGQGSFSHFYTPTIGLNLEKKIVKIDKRLVTLCIWDTAGQQKFFALTKGYFKKADGVLIIFDITDPHTFDRIQKYWIQQIKQKSDVDCIKILIGNKSDCLQQRKIKFQQGKTLADRYGFKYFQTSAKTGENVQDAFLSLAKDCSQKVKADIGKKPEDEVDLNKPQKKTWSFNCIGKIKGLYNKLLDKQ